MTDTLLSPPTEACSAVVHFFIGMMKADGTVTEAEQRKVEILAHKFRHVLPFDATALVPAMTSAMSQQQYDQHLAMDHMDVGLKYFDAFVASGQAEEEHMSAVLEMLEILMEVDGVTANEELYFSKLKEAFDKRYGA